MAECASVGAADHQGNAPSSFAAANGYKEIVELLVAAGAAVGATDLQGFIAADHAQAQGHVQIAEKLRAAGDLTIIFIQSPRSPQTIQQVLPKAPVTSAPATHAAVFFHKLGHRLSETIPQGASRAPQLTSFNMSIQAESGIFAWLIKVLLTMLRYLG